ncbi:DnaJ domain-containing protein [Aestuariivirga sp.]|uniref:J domain-containing protein n=1 Tax=Aestuariivirga sp. TaxID=2650926 RepID=UPI0039193FED
MERGHFIDYYEVLGLELGASSEAISRQFYKLAKRYHPDNPLTGNREKFDLIAKAHDLLKDAERRSQYDLRHGHVRSSPDHSSGPASTAGSVEKDMAVQERLLHVFYARRRHSVKSPGVPDFELERTFGCPLEQLDFHLWYLKAKRWIERLEDGMLAITVDGIDHVNAEHQRNATIGLLMQPEHQQESFA